jgi:hypothetical protein
METSNYNSLSPIIQLSRPDLMRLSPSRNSKFILSKPLRSRNKERYSLPAAPPISSTDALLKRDTMYQGKFQARIANLGAR